MKLFIDSAKLDEIKEAYSMEILDGVTTNPSLIKKAAEESGKKINMKEYIKQILTTAKGTPVSLEVTETKHKAIVKQGKALFKLFNPVAKNVYIKVPVNTSFDENPNIDGIKAIKELSNAKIPINCTLIFTPEQALLAEKAGAKFVSPFAGRIDDLIRKNHNIPFEKTDYFPSYGWHAHHKILEDNGIISGIDLVKQCVDIFKKHNIQSEVLAASIRNARQAREAALVGADIATIPLAAIKELLYHKKTSEGMVNFTKDIIPQYTKMVK